MYFIFLSIIYLSISIEHFINLVYNYIFEGSTEYISKQSTKTGQLTRGQSQKETEIRPKSAQIEITERECLEHIKLST